MKWRASSCFDCVRLQEPSHGVFYCGGYNKPLSYDVARTINNCEIKQPHENGAVRIPHTPKQEILEKLYQTCVKYAELALGPFTARELVYESDYDNKNSLWELLEELVKQKRLNKGKMTVVTRYGRAYKSNVYFPIYVELQPRLA